MLNLNKSPYYDDFDETKKFLKILFRPSYAIQARELTQLQTMLQNQIGRFGSHIFANGSRVVDAQMAYEPNAVSIKITATDIDTTTNITNMFNYFTIDTNIITVDEVKASIVAQGYLANRNGVTGLVFSNGNAKLKVVALYPPAGADPATIICVEMTGVHAANNTTYTASTGKTFLSNPSSAIGEATTYAINSGVYFVNNLFAYVEKQTVVTSKYNRTPNIRVGLSINEYIVTTDTDQSLLDPARGSINYNAPGADRYAIDLILTTKDLDVVDVVDGTSGINYVDLAKIVDGVIAAQREFSTYSDIEDTLARRTFDESGDYTVNAFGIQYRDHPSDSTKFQVGMGAGVAYVRGYEFRTISTTWLDADRARTVDTITNNTIPTLYGNYVLVDTGSGTAVGNLPVLTGDIVQLWDAVTSGTQVGTAKVRLLYRMSATQYRIYLTDVAMSSGNFSSVRSMRYTGGVRWDILLTSGNAVLNDPTANVLLFKQLYNSIQTFTNKTFNYMKTVSVTSGFWSGSGPYVATNISPSTNEFFITADNSNGFAPYTVIDSTGAIRTITALSVAGGGAVTITISAGSGAPGNCTVYAPVYRSISSPRVKTLVSPTITAAAGVGVTTFNLISGSRNYYDIQAIASIKHSAAPTIEIKSKFSMFDGQTDNYYGLGSVTWIDAGAIPTTGTFTIIFDSYDHSNDASGTGYFTVDSYTGTIPSYTSKITNIAYSLRDTIDFRPTISDTLGVTTFKNQALPIPLGIGAEFIATYSYYLPRRDKLVLTKDRKFVVVQGIPALNPIVPSDLPETMTLYTMYVPAYTYTSNSINTTYIENKRYTMRDIGRIDQRVSRVEYYTSLSLLEKQAKDKNLLTSAGVNAFKNGILVDSFSGHSVGDVANTEYKCSIDYSNLVLRPSIDVRNYGFSRVSGGTLASANIVTLPYTVATYVDQPLASEIINVTPYDVASWIGTMTLSPSSDTWFDTVKAPDVIQNVSGSNDNWVFLGANAVGTQYDFFNSGWVGKVETIKVDGRTTFQGDYHNNYSGTVATTTDLGINTIVADKIISSTVVPFMRQRVVSFTADGLKPFTQVYTYFDDVQVNVGVNMFTDVLGSITGTFTVPPNINVGTRPFTVTDRAPAAPYFYTEANAQYSAAGILNTVQSTRVMKVVRTPFVVDEVVRRVQYIDPLAESFFVNSKEYPNGLFLDSVDVYFTSKAATLPVIMQLRPMVNGYPSSTEVIPFSEVTLAPSSVTIAADRYNPTVADKTRFQFKAPIFLAPGDYCFVLLSTTTEYQVYMATMGFKQLGSNNIIGKQPYIGSLFKSQNAQTWTASQDNDLMFRLNKCVFSTSSTDVIFSNTVDAQSDVFNYHLVNVNPSTVEFSNANISWFKKAIPTGGTLEASYTAFNTSTNLEQSQEYQIQGTIANQLAYKATMITTDPNVSPVIDLDRCFSIFVKNVINTDLTNETIAKTGNALAKYETRAVTLAAGFESVGLNVTFDAYLPGIADVYVYYKTANTGNQIDFDKMGWTLLSGTAGAVHAPVNRLGVDVPYTEYNFKTTVALPLYNLYSVKLVMVGLGVNCPLIKDLRVIAFS